MKTKLRVKSSVAVQILDKDGEVKERLPGERGGLFHLNQGRLMEQRFNRVVIREWGILIAGALLSPEGSIRIGMEKGINTDGVYTQSLDNGYPALKRNRGAGAGAISIIYRATFPAGSLNVKGINEARLLDDGDSPDSCLALVRFKPVVDVLSDDTLRIEWEITITN
jgi:hypothetical protein